MAQAVAAEAEIPPRFYTNLRKRIYKNVSDMNANGLGCWEWGGPKKTGANCGSVHLRLGMDRTTVNAPRASFIAFNEKFVLGDDISHCCHHSSCVNPSHLSHETHDINMAREQCRKPKQCSGHTNAHGEALKHCLFVEQQ